MARTKHKIDWHKPIIDGLKEMGITAHQLSEESGISYQSIATLMSKGAASQPTLEVVLQCKLVEIKARMEKERIEAILLAKGIAAKVDAEVIRDIFTVRIEGKDFSIYRDCFSGKYGTNSKKEHFLTELING